MYILSVNKSPVKLLRILRLSMGGLKILGFSPLRPVWYVDFKYVDSTRKYIFLSNRRLFQF